MRIVIIAVIVLVVVALSYYFFYMKIPKIEKQSIDWQNKVLKFKVGGKSHTYSWKDGMGMNISTGILGNYSVSLSPPVSGRLTIDVSQGGKIVTQEFFYA